MKPTKHVFTLTVKTTMSRNRAWICVLSAFAKRYPDDCEFHLKKKKPKK